MHKKPYAIGVDFGGTNTKLAVCNKQGKILGDAAFKTSDCPRPKDFAERLNKEIQALLASRGIRKKQVMGVGIGLPGLVDPFRGMVHTLVNVPGWNHCPAGALLKRVLGLPVRLENDVNAMALGELRFGSAKGCRNAVCVTLGTGVGGGIIMEGKLYRGATLTAGEIGHIVVNVQGPRCNCGSRGCLEALVGTQGLLNRARELLKQGRHGILASMLARGEKLSPRLLSEAAAQKDAVALQVWNEAATHLGIVFAGVANLLNPEKIVLGGGVSAAGGFFMQKIRAVLRQTAMAVPAQKLNVVRSRLGHHGGVLGAASLVFESN